MFWINLGDWKCPASRVHYRKNVNDVLSKCDELVTLWHVNLIIYVFIVLPGIRKNCFYQKLYLSYTKVIYQPITTNKIIIKFFSHKNCQLSELIMLACHKQNICFLNSPLYFWTLQWMLTKDIIYLRLTLFFIVKICFMEILKQ